MIFIHVYEDRRLNMSRFYTHCLECRKRMIKFCQDVDGERIFYFCRNCGNRFTYFPTKNATSKDWPKDIFDDAVRCGVMTREGRLI